MTFKFKFFPIKDFIFSVIPTAASYEGYLKDLIPLDLLSNQYAELGVGAGLSILLALIFYRENLRSYKKSLAEILATGYFNNFTGRLGRILKSKKPLTFIFPQDQEHTVHSANIKLQVALPTSLAALQEYSDDIIEKYPIAYLKDAPTAEPFWVRAEVDDKGHMTIYEYPRTLFALPTYLKKDFANEDKAEKSSKKLFKYFNAKIESARIAHSWDIPKKKFVFDYI